jgi:endo-1,4-beta-xylanase
VERVNRKLLQEYAKLLCMLLVFVIAACSSSSTQTLSIKPTSTTQPAHTPPHMADSTLRSLAQARHFYIGTTVDVKALSDEPAYSATLAREFNMVTPEVSMKFSETEPQPGVYTFAKADSIVAFAQAHQIQVRGHNLVWYTDLPAWLTNGTFTRDQLITILRDHIMTEVTRYRAEVNIWDVVNEAVGDNGALRDSIWLRGIGPQYIDMAFQWAHEANPQARLFYNDYGGEGLGRKSDAIYALVKGMLQRGVPIDGVGLQMHISLDSYPNPQDVLANMQRLTSLGLEVQITEMDVKTQDDPRPMAAKLAAQAQLYGEMLHTCLSVPRCTAFVMWGFTDKYSWIPAATGHPDYPLIFDAEYRPKPAYFALQQTLHPRDAPVGVFVYAGS